jgi:multidrug efflux pump subunit AcrA (membrane-fusion protein)
MNKFKKIFVIGFGVLLVAATITLISCSKGDKETPETQMTAEKATAEREILYYTCGMHPSVRVSPEDYEKGNTSCPICNMGLVPVYKEEGEMAEMESGELEAMEREIKLNERAQRLAQVKTEEIQFRQIFREIKTVGEIDYDERKVAFVAAWIPGRIDKLFVDFTGVQVRKGAPLVWIYSPDLVTTQQEYLLALETLEKVKESPHGETIEGARSLVEASKNRLLLWGVSERQIKELEEKGEASTHMIIHAPIGGTVIHKNALEGKYVKKGENLYQIANLSNVWVLADIYESDLASIEKGQNVEITTSALSGEKFEGQISFIDPFLNPKTRTVKVRVDVSNTQMKLKPGMYVNAFLSAHVHDGIQGSARVIYECPMHPEIQSDKPDDCSICGMALVEKPQAPAGSVLAVPRSAVLDTGERKLVYIEKENGVYVPKEIEVGSDAIAVVDGQKKKFYSVRAGLSEGMKVATQANFLIDSQSQITGQAEAIYSGALEKDKKKKTPPSKHIH